MWAGHVMRGGGVHGRVTKHLRNVHTLYTWSDDRYIMFHLAYLLAEALTTASIGVPLQITYLLLWETLSCLYRHTHHSTVHDQFLPHSESDPLPKGGHSAMRWT